MTSFQRSKNARYAEAVKTKNNILNASSVPPPVLPYKDQLSKVEQAVAELKESILINPTSTTVPLSTSKANTKKISTVYGHDPWNVSVTNPKAGVHVYQPPRAVASRSQGSNRNVQVLLPSANVGIQADVVGYILPELPRKHVQAVGETATQTDIMDATALYKQNGYNHLDRDKKLSKKISKENTQPPIPFDLHTHTNNCQHSKYTDIDHDKRTLVGIRRTGGGYTNIVHARSIKSSADTVNNIQQNTESKNPTIKSTTSPSSTSDNTSIPIPTPTNLVTKTDTLATPPNTSSTASSSITMDQLLTFVSVFGSELAKSMGQATADIVQQTLLSSLPVSYDNTELPISNSVENKSSSSFPRRPSISRDKAFLHQDKVEALRSETNNLVLTVNNLQNNMNTIIKELLDHELPVNSLITEVTNTSQAQISSKPPLQSTGNNSTSNNDVQKYKATMKSTVTVTPRRQNEQKTIDPKLSDNNIPIVYDTTITNAKIDIIPVFHTEELSNIKNYSNDTFTSQTLPIPPVTIRNHTASLNLSVASNGIDTLTQTKPDVPKEIPVGNPQENLPNQTTVFKPISRRTNTEKPENLHEQISGQIADNNAESTKLISSTTGTSNIENSKRKVSIPPTTTVPVPDQLNTNESYQDPYLDLLQTMEKDISGDKETILPLTTSNTTIQYESLSKYPHPESVRSVSTNSSTRLSIKSNNNTIKSSANILKSNSTQARTITPSIIIKNSIPPSSDIYTDTITNAIPSYAQNSVLGALLASENRSSSSTRSSIGSRRFESSSHSHRSIVDSSSIISQSRPPSSLSTIYGSENPYNIMNGNTVIPSTSPLVILAQHAIQDAQKAIENVSLK